jgi:hypothetical protein
VLQVTPNGPWGKDVHPRMPVLLDEVISDLSACFDVAQQINETLDQAGSACPRLTHGMNAPQIAQAESA